MNIFYKAKAFPVVNFKEQMMIRLDEIKKKVYSLTNKIMYTMLYLKGEEGHERC